MTTLKIDLDTLDRSMVVEVAKRCGFVSAYMDSFGFKFCVKQTNRGYHLYIGCSQRLNDDEVVALQAILADDWKRSVFNFRHVQNNVKNWNVLFQSTEHSEPIALVFLMMGAYAGYRAYYRLLRKG